MRRSLYDLSIRWRLLIVPLAALLGLALIAMSILGGLTSVQEANRRTLQAREVLQQSSELERAFFALRWATRESLVRAGSADLSRLGTDRDLVDAEYRTLHALVADNPTQVARLEDVHGFLSAWQAEVLEPILRGAPGLSVTFELERSAELAQRIHLQILALEAAEEQLLAQRSALAEAALQRAMFDVGAALLGTLLLLAIGSATISHTVIGPLERLTRAAERFGRGDLAARARLPSRDELGRLGLAFDQLVELVAARRAERERAEAELRALNAVLEQRVAERTTELEATVQDLQGQIAERQRAEATAREGEGREGAILEGALDCIIIVDHEGNVVEFNPAAERTFGYRRDEVHGLPLADLIIPPALRERHRNGLPRYLTTGEATVLNRQIELPAMRADGTEFPVEIAIVPIHLQGQPAFAGFLRDITERKRVEDERAHRLAQEEAARAKDELVSVVSHELRTPLASLVGFAELLLARNFAEEQRREFLTLMLQEGRRLTALVNDFLDLQRMESGNQQISVQPTDLLLLLAGAIAAAGEDPARPIALEVPDALPWVLADPDRLRQVLANLLSNARRYSPAGGVVQLTAREADGQVQVSVADQGLGVPAAALPRLFDKFYRVDNSDRREIKGTGLGLAIVKQIVEAHGGQVRVESAGIGQGTRFTFELPRAEQTSPTGEVLVVEDDSAFARLLAVELAGHGLSIVRVTSAEAALAQAANRPPRAVLLDLMLPGMSGECCLRQLREAGLRDTPVVVITVKDLDAAARSALAAEGVVAVLRKESGVAPAVARVLVQALKDVKPAVLVVDDDPRLRSFLSQTVRQAGYSTIDAGGPAEALLALERNPAVALVLTDVRMPAPVDGVEFIRTVRRRWPELPLAAVAGNPDDLADLHGSPECPVLILPKPVRGRRLQEVLQMTLQQPAPAVAAVDATAPQENGSR